MKVSPGPVEAQCPVVGCRERLSVANAARPMLGDGGLSLWIDVDAISAVMRDHITAAHRRRATRGT